MRYMYPKIPAPTSTTTTTATTVVVATPFPAIWGRRTGEKFKRIGSSIYIELESKRESKLEPKLEPERPRDRAARGVTKLSSVAFSGLLRAG